MARAGAAPRERDIQRRRGAVPGQRLDAAILVFQVVRIRPQVLISRRADDLITADERPEEPTPACAWRAVAQSPATDELLECPQDVFALTEVILARSEAYRFALSPPGRAPWPPARFANWPEAVQDAGLQWSAWAEDHRGPLPALVAAEWDVFRERAGKPLRLLAEGGDWRMCEALLTLHAIADEACAGLGTGSDRSDGHGCAYRTRSRYAARRSIAVDHLSVPR